MEQKKCDEQSEKEEKKKKKPLHKMIVIAIAVVLCAVIILVVSVLGGKEETNPQYLTASTLEKIIQVEDLSTYTAIFNGIATKPNHKKPEKIDYYVAYNATVKAGISLEEVQVSVDREAKEIQIILPEVKITDVQVDMASLDFIFEDGDDDATGLSAEAYKLCVDEAEKEAKENTAILELARENAVNSLKALTKPFVEQLDETYTLNIE